jgi:2-succinyl-5-enolpyruvyl-6-hydroxy-3-cyclohexene-1-carboxylate synthase
LAFQHDLGGLVAAINDEPTLTIVVVENQGGAIFGYLPISEVVDVGLFRQLFTTPPSLNIAEVVKALGIEHIQISDLRSLGGHLERHEGLRVISIAINPDLDMDQHHRIREAIQQSIAMA